MNLPVNTLAEAIPELRRPFTPEAVKWKIQVNPKGDNGRAMVVAYIDARLASERLNAVCPQLWSTEFESVDGGMLCKLTIDGRTRADVGYFDQSDQDRAEIAIKGLYSDAFKRAAVHFGVGASLYTLPRAFVAASDLKKSGKSWYITDALERRLRGGYAAWLKGTGKGLFGESLGHGDLEGAQGDHEAEVPVAADGDAPPETNGTNPDGPTDKQLAFVENLVKRAGAEDSDALKIRGYIGSLNKGVASANIEALKANPGEATAELVEAAEKWQATQSDVARDQAELEPAAVAPSGDDPF